MGTISRNKVWVNGDILTASDLNTEFNTVYNEFNGNIDENNIKTTANPTVNNLTASGILRVDTITEKTTGNGVVFSVFPITPSTAPSTDYQVANKKYCDDNFVTPTGTITLTNKRITKRETTITSSSTPTPNSDTTDIYTITALAVNATFGAPTGTPTQGQTLLIRIKDDGTARTLSWNAIYRAIGLTLPTTTVANKNLYLGFIYNSTDSKWDCIAYTEEA